MGERNQRVATSRGPGGVVTISSVNIYLRQAPMGESIDGAEWSTSTNRTGGNTRDSAVIQVFATDTLGTLGNAYALELAPAPASADAATNNTLQARAKLRALGYESMATPDAYLRPNDQDEDRASYAAMGFQWDNNLVPDGDPANATNQINQAYDAIVRRSGR